MKVDFVNFPERQDRSRYVAKTFEPFFKGKVLDVGCWEGALKGFLPPCEYTGIDIAGKPDLRVDLEVTTGLPFPDHSFDAVVCADVLEHLNNLHHVFTELVRVCRGHLIISLPNCWACARQPIERGRGSFSHYGLPADKPMDRHKWFFSLTEAQDFMHEQVKRHPVRIKEFLVNEKPRPAPLRWMRHLRFPNKEHYLNRYSHTLWTVLEVEEN